MEFVRTTLGDISVGEGQYGIGAKAVNYSDDLFTYLRITDINDDGTLNTSGLKSVNHKKAKQYILQPNDIVFARTGNSTGRNYFYDGSDGTFVYAGFLIKFSIDPMKVNPKYIKYYCLSNAYKGWIQGYSEGSTRGNINAKTYSNMEILLPPRAQQNKLVNILQALDDKIAINNRINRNLEQQIESVYLERFGTETNGVLADLCEYSKFKIGVQDLTEDTYYSTENMLPNKQGATKASGLPTTNKTPKCTEGDVLISNIRPYFKKIVYCYETAGCSTDVLCFTAKNKKLSPYLYATLFVDKFFDFMVANSGGTKMPRGDKQKIMQYPVHIPTGEELKDFGEFAETILKVINMNNKENMRLQGLRDTLLPKLMSGELDVSELDI